MAKQTFTSGQVLTAAQVNALQTNDFNQTVSTKTAAYTFVVGDRGTRVVLNDTTARTFTIDNNIFSAGDTIYVHNINTGVLTIAAGAGVTLNGADVLTVAQWQSGTIYFTSASSAIFFPTAKTVTSKFGQIQTATKADAFSTTSTTFTDVTGVTVNITPTLSSSQVLVMVTLQGSNAVGDGAFRLMRGSTVIALSTAGSTTNGFTQVSSSYTNAMFSGAITFLDSPATTSATTYKVQAMTSAGGTTYVNRRGVAADFGGFSTITVIEVLA